MTGAGGFIGQYLVRRLSAGGFEVHAVGRRSIGPGCGEHAWWPCDLTQPQQVGELFKSVAPDRVVHLAAEVSGDRSVDRVVPMLQANLLAAVAVMVEAAQARCRRVVLAGSMDVPHDAPAAPVSPYAAAKGALAQYARMFGALYALDVVTARIGMTYGPGQSDHTKLVPYVIRCALRGETPELGSGRRSVDWVYVDDVAEGLERCCLRPGLAGATIDLGTGVATSIRAVVERAVKLANPTVSPRFGAREDRALDPDWKAVAEQTEAQLGWRPATSLEDGLARTVDWYRAEAS